MNITAILTVSLILFSVIDIIGSLPVLINMRRDGTVIRAGLATGSAAVIMFAFMFFGAAILGLFGISVEAFAMAGAIIILFIGLEMILGIRIFRNHHDDGGSGSIVPVAFPLLAGAGTLTTILSLKADYDNLSLTIGILLNLVFCFIILRSIGWISDRMSPAVASTLRKIFGVVLMAIAIQMVRDNI